MFEEKEKMNKESLISNNNIDSDNNDNDVST